MALAGIRVLDLSRLLPGAFCSLVLSELGADVVKVEDTRVGDYLREIPPVLDGLGGAFYALNRGKRSVAVDLRQDAGRELLLRLLPDYHVVLESFRPGVLEQLGLGFSTLKAAHPEVILCSITGYGQTGPLRDRAGHDINYMALSGVLAVGGERDDAPCQPGVQVADLAGGGLWAAIRILAALHGGRGTHLDVSMTEGAMSLLLPWLGEMAFGGRALRRGEGLLNGGSPSYDIYPTADGRYLAVGALEPKFWSALLRVLGVDGQPDPRQQMHDRVAAQISAATRDAWTERLQGFDTCVEPVLEMDELQDHPLHRQRKMFYELQDPSRGPITQLRLPVDEPSASSPAPRLGEHTGQVLAEHGLSREEIQRLRADGIIR